MPGFILALGIGLSLALQVHSRDGVFFNGEAGLKALLAQQFSTGQLRASLDMSQPQWVLALWRQGLYPFAPPFAYEQQGNYFIRFLFTFPAITAPFYALVGYRGLYVVPLVSLWIIWWRLCLVCRVWRVRSIFISLSLVLVIAASPLTLYGAMYWEHTLAVALAFWGLSGLLLHVLPGDSHDDERISLNEALVNGGCVGLSVWVRPELLCLVLILGMMAVASQVRQLAKPLRLVIPRGLTLGLVVAFNGAMGLTVLGFFGANLVFYGHPLGIYAAHTPLSLGQQVAQTLGNYGQMVLSLGRYFPAVLLGLGLPWCLKGPARAASSGLAVMGILFAIAVPLISSSVTEAQQWGPRFYLILVPMVGLIVAAGLQHLWHLKRQRRGLLAAIAIVLALGIHTNLVNGTLNVYRDPQTNSASLPSVYEPIAPAITALANYDERWVAISHQAVAQQLWPSVKLKTFFRAETDAAVAQLAAELVNQKEFSFLYICHPDHPCEIPNQGTLKSKLLGGDNDDAAMSIFFEPLGTFGQYPFYRGFMQTQPASQQASKLNP
ncbi:LA_3751/LA_3752 family putative glycosyltransferase [Leptothoe sp. PORK10 BA2]|uniref:LA_3751/LA_3752 family putative glycosyltransferase n=1 Tax=Leptothoe sp. PORK10 BA2 TaxID=3110254 RepID=UPI002B21DC24|nr:hypothetical protein [Leptothoe sp. PORK10 BA2]MEA5466258.1 hypothetical protein [Leptothoe sp. PORK10 BA2]